MYYSAFCSLRRDIIYYYSFAIAIIISHLYCMFACLFVCSFVWEACVFVYDDNMWFYESVKQKPIWWLHIQSIQSTILHHTYNGTATPNISTMPMHDITIITNYYLDYKYRCTFVHVRVRVWLCTIFGWANCQLLVASCLQTFLHRIANKINGFIEYSVFSYSVISFWISNWKQHVMQF